MPLRSRLPPVLERKIDDFLVAHAKHQNKKEFDFVGFNEIHELKGIEFELSTHASCVFVREGSVDRFRYSLVPSVDAYDIVKENYKVGGSFVFYFYTGSVYISFGNSDDGLVPEMYISAGGLMVAYCEALCARLSGKARQSDAPNTVT